MDQQRCTSQVGRASWTSSGCSSPWEQTTACVPFHSLLRIKPAQICPCPLQFSHDQHETSAICVPRPIAPTTFLKYSRQSRGQTLVSAVLQTVKNDGQTALHEAAEAGRTDTVQYLLSIGANAQAQDEVSIVTLSSPMCPYEFCAAGACVLPVGFTIPCISSL